MTRRAEPELLEAKQLLSRAKVLCGLTAKDVAAALGCSKGVADKLWEPSQREDNMRIGDLILLSKHPSMRAFVAEVLGGIQANFNLQTLRICDLQTMTMSSTSRVVAREALRDVVAKLYPEFSADTSEPER